MRSGHPTSLTSAYPTKSESPAFEAEDRLPLPMLGTIQRAADLLEEIGWAVQPRSCSGPPAVVLKGFLPCQQLTPPTEPEGYMAQPPA